jgi:predicted DNA binding protein
MNDESRPSEDESMVVFEFAVPAETFILEDALREHPEVVVEIERLVPTNHTPLPYLWTTDGQSPSFEDAISDDPRIDRVVRKTTFEEGGLYRIEWGSDDGGLLDRISDTDSGIALLQAEGQGDEWRIKLRFPSRSQLTDFRTFYEERGIDLRVIRLYDLTDPKMGQYNISQKQREALICALEMGHFQVPREASLEDIAETLDISPRAVSERLRRGQTNLISNSLTIGQPSGIGLGGQE